MQKRLLLAIISAFVLASPWLLPAPGYGQQGSQKGFQYVVKFLCGDADVHDARGLDINGDGVVDTGQFIARGEYHTVINIHNPNNRFVNMFKKIALDYYQIVEEAFIPNDDDPTVKDVITPKKPRFLFQVPGPTFFINIVDGQHPPLSAQFDPDGDGLPRYFSLTPVAIKLSPDETFHINCPEIRAVVNDWTNKAASKRAGDAQKVNQAATAGGFGEAFLIKGYVVIFSEAKLDVTAIYTACGEGGANALDCGTNFGVQSVDIEEIKENVVAPPSNLVPPKPTATLLASGELKVALKATRLSALAESRLAVYHLNGRLIYDSGFVGGGELAWRPMSANGAPLANGVYLYVVSVRDVFGRMASKVGKFALLRR